MSEQQKELRRTAFRQNDPFRIKRGGNFLEILGRYVLIAAIAAVFAVPDPDIGLFLGYMLDIGVSALTRNVSPLEAWFNRFRVWIFTPVTFFLYSLR
ncbi:MAG: hypothetical protein LBH00_09455 [Planctomycetaceae bacterium]|jgi:hypothetical protein|nr:hypothetical protein [Planctomycetaceae bacterium]